MNIVGLSISQWLPCPLVKNLVKPTSILLIQSLASLQCTSILLLQSLASLQPTSILLLQSLASLQCYKHTTASITCITTMHKHTTASITCITTIHKHTTASITCITTTHLHNTVSMTFLASLYYANTHTVRDAMLDEIFPKQLITAKLGGSEFRDRDHQLGEPHWFFSIPLYEIFYYPWRTQAEGAITYSVSSERHSQSRVNEIAQVLKQQH